MGVKKYAEPRKMGDRRRGELEIKWGGVKQIVKRWVGVRLETELFSDSASQLDKQGVTKGQNKKETKQLSYQDAPQGSNYGEGVKVKEWMNVEYCGLTGLLLVLEVQVC